MTDGLETFPHGQTRHYTDGGNIVIIRGSGDMSRSATDVFMNLIVDTMQTWSAGENIYALVDVSHKNQGFTPYSRQRAQDTLRHLPTQGQHYVAVVLSNYIFSRLLNVFLMTQRGKYKNMHLRMFHGDEAEALAWLRQHQQG